ncbi:MAG TPA: universal stress protein [Micromonosporaceae bacterium]|jgi:nucleotide-binding universal stress UspA family protein
MNDQLGEAARRIVVGIDGSDGSKTALAWAMTEARHTHAIVEAVTTWQDPVTYGYAYGWMPTVEDGESIAAIMAKVLDDAIVDVSARLEDPVTVRPRILEGHASHMLLDAAAGALLLVVGSRGHSTYSGILLGSVSQHCVQHPPCPVVVVPR